jgi:hypothetical protein
VLQVRQGRVTGAEIIDGQFHTDCLQLREHIDGAFGIIPFDNSRKSPSPSSKSLHGRPNPFQPLNIRPHRATTRGCLYFPDLHSSFVSAKLLFRQKLSKPVFTLPLPLPSFSRGVSTWPNTNSQALPLPGNWT